MDANQRKMMRELDQIVEEVGRQADLYERTGEWSIDGEEGPVDLDIARYVLPEAEHFLELWNRVHDAAKNNAGLPVKEEPYREIEEKIHGYSSFIEDVYGFDKPLGKKKVEARYAW